MGGILGTQASLASDLTLLAYIVVLVPGILLGFFFARRKRFNSHRAVMTIVTITNWVLIILLMSISYRDFVAPALSAGDTDIRTLLPLIHLITGGIAQLLATYLVILMWTEGGPMERAVLFRIKRIKTPMRLTLSLWLVTVLLGVGIYFTWYGGPPTVQAEGTAPVATEESAAPAVTEEAIAEEATEAAPDATEEAAQPAPDATEEVPEPAATEENSG